MTPNATLICPHSPVTPGMTAVVVGAAGSGMAAAQLLHALGARVRVVDSDGAKVSDGAREIMARLGCETAFGEHTAEQFAGAELVVPSPGVPVKKIAPLLPEGALVMAETELAWLCVRHIPVLAVTGTNGKSTTVSLCARMLEQAGKKVFLGGNFGTPLSRFVLDAGKADVLVLEVSSFQLQTCTAFHPKVGVLTNITVDHLDYHSDMQEYTDAKMRLFARQTADDTAIFGPGLDALPQEYGVRAAVRSFDAPEGTAARFPQSRLMGRHNRLNMEAAYMACAVFGVTQEEAARAVRDFRAAEHTLEPVGEACGVLFVNDSKATTVDSVRVALEAFDTPVLLLAGGKYKGGDLASLRGLLQDRVRAVGLYGGSREIFEQAWAGAAELSYDATMQAAAARLMDKAQPGDVLLLAPATSSFDQYANYKERGEDFRRICAQYRAAEEAEQ